MASLTPKEVEALKEAGIEVITYHTVVRSEGETPVAMFLKKNHAIIYRNKYHYLYEIEDYTLQIK